MPDAVYAQSLLGFAENSVSYATVRAGKDDEDIQKRRLNDAERAVKYGLAVIKETARKDQERTGKNYLELIQPSFAVQIQELLRRQSKKIQQTRKDLELE